MTKAKTEYSSFQKEIFKFIEENEESLLINAVAGSGKTTTIIKGIDYVPKGKSILFLAFNKAIVNELKDRLPEIVDTSTFHSVGFRAWATYCGKGEKIQVSDRKVQDLINKVLNKKYPSKADNEKKFSLFNFIRRLVPLAKNAGVGTEIQEDTLDNWLMLVDHHDVQYNEVIPIEKAIELCSQVLKESSKMKHIIDFDDMLYMPLLYGAKFRRYDYIFIDEVQDTNKVQAYLLEAMMKINSRVIGVGDRNQAIYGFRGANADAMEFFKDNFDCQELPLSITYRCGREIVKLAKEIVPQIEFGEKNVLGEVKTLEKYNAKDFEETDVIICRNVAPLVTMAYGFIRRGIAARVLGREIGAGLIALIKKMNAKSIDDLENKIEVWAKRELEKAVAKGKNASAIEDQMQCIMVFIKNLQETSRTINKLISNIEALFDDDNKRGILLCSVHKSKGLEWDKVYLLDPWRIPSRWAVRDWMKQQENNLKYVAYTRARSSLIFINSDCWLVKEEKKKKKK